jgi:hypothetical protein
MANHKVPKRNAAAFGSAKLRRIVAQEIHLQIELLTVEKVPP